MGYKLTGIYVGQDKVRPSGLSMHYDMRGGSLAGLQQAGFTNIYTDGSYTFDSDGLMQTNGGNDRYTYVYVDGLDFSDVHTIKIASLGHWYNGSWSGGIRVNATTGFSSGNFVNPTISGLAVPNSNVGYQTSSISYNQSGSWVALDGITQNLDTGDYTLTLLIDLVNQTVDFTCTGDNTFALSHALTNTQVAEIRNMTTVVYDWTRGYSSYDPYIRLKEIRLQTT